ncbi:MAG: DUF6259 domain-containing protein [bacterium]
MQISSNKKSIKINTGKVVLEFTLAEGVQFNRLSQPNGVNLLKTIVNNTLRWNVILKTKQGQDVSVSSENSQFIKHTIKRKGKTQAIISFVWEYQIKNQEKLNIKIHIRCESGNPLTYWSLEVTNLPKGLVVTQTDFPIIPNIELKKESKIAVPHGWGIEDDLKPGYKFEAVYPYCQCVMQFLAIYSQGIGLYLGTHDPDAHMKQFSVTAENDKVDIKLTHWAGIPKRPISSYKTPFEIAIGVYQGEYYEAAQIYREFTFKTPWGASKSIAKRKTPDWLKQTVLWLRPKGVEKNTIEFTQQALDYFAVPTALHWYQWHKIPYDTLYPEYFPTKPEFPKAVKEMQQLGTYVMPYINGRLWDPASKSWKSEHAKETTAALKEDNETYIEVYGSQVPLAVMCPYTKPWQCKVKELVGRLMNEVGVNGVYIDQIGAASAVKCYNSNHGHPVGGGSFWHEGYRNLLTRIRKSIPKDKMITTEENIETWLDQFDAMLLVNTHTQTGRLIPLYPAVYSDRTILFAYQYLLEDDLDKIKPYRAKVAQCFLFGSQLGWIEPGLIMVPKYRKEAEYLKTLAKTRRFALNLLNYGRFLGLIEVKGDNPQVKSIGKATFGGTYKLDIPAVIAAAWLGKDGTAGIILVNQTDKDHKVKFEIPIEKFGISKKKIIRIQLFGPDGFESESILKSTCLQLTIPARTAKIIQIPKK